MEDRIYQRTAYVKSNLRVQPEPEKPGINPETKISPEFEKLFFENRSDERHGAIVIHKSLGSTEGSRQQRNDHATRASKLEERIIFHHWCPNV